MQHNLETKAAQIAHYSAIKARLYGPGQMQRPKLALVPPPQPKPEPAKEAHLHRFWAPMWRRTDINFDAHVKAWQWHVASSYMKATKAYVIRLCEHLGIGYETFIGKTRKHPIVDHRLIAMWVLRNDFGCSLPEVGRLLGGRDHSTCNSGIKKVSRLIEDGLDVTEFRRAFIGPAHEQQETAAE